MYCICIDIHIHIWTEKTCELNTGLTIHLVFPKSLAWQSIVFYFYEYKSFSYWVHHLMFFFQLLLISWMVTLSSCLICQIISFNLSPNEYVCVYAWTILGSAHAIDLQKMPSLTKKKSSFQMKLKIVTFATHALKSRCTHKGALFGADFGPET